MNKKEMYLEYLKPEELLLIEALKGSNYNEMD